MTFRERLIEKTGIDRHTLDRVANYLADNHQDWSEVERDIWVDEGKPGYRSPVPNDQLMRLAMVLRR